MIHTLHSITIRQYSIVDETDDLSLLRRWFNPFPVKWFNTEKFFVAYRDVFGTNNKNELRNEVYRLLSYNKITSLDRMLKMMSLLMRNQNERALFSLILKTEIKEYKGNLDFYIKRVKEITGIEIKDGNDLKRLAQETERLLDKYIERFNKIKKIQCKKCKWTGDTTMLVSKNGNVNNPLILCPDCGNDDIKEPKETVFMDFLLSIFDIMGDPYQPNMRLWEFGRLKKRADKKITQEKTRKTRQK